MSRFATYFLRGLVVVGPLAITLYLAWVVFTRIDRWLGLPIPGLGFLLTIGLITVVGFLASNLITRTLVGLIDRMITRLPFVRLLYSSTKDLLNAFVGEKRRFDKPVLVTLMPGGSARAFGFITRASLEGLGLPGHVAVYMPHSYNFSGQLAVFPREHVTPLDAESSEVMAFIVSGGVTGMHGAMTGEQAAFPKPR